MAIGVIGRKCGMTRVFSEDGVSVPVTVLEVGVNRVAQVKSLDSDGYASVQVAYGSKKASSLTKAQAGHLAKAGVDAAEGLAEFRLEDVSGFELGTEIGVDLFAEGQSVDVSGVSKGKGFAGVVKRWNFRTQDATHGNSLSHRAPGSIGQNQTPGRVFKGKKMAGHLGGVRVSVQGLEVVRVDVDKGLLLLKGAVPGAVGSSVIVRPSVKSRA